MGLSFIGGEGESGIMFRERVGGAEKGDREGERGGEWGV